VRVLGLQEEHLACKKFNDKVLALLIFLKQGTDDLHMVSF